MASPFAWKSCSTICTDRRRPIDCLTDTSREAPLSPNSRTVQETVGLRLSRTLLDVPAVYSLLRDILG